MASSSRSSLDPSNDSVQESALATVSYKGKNSFYYAFYLLCSLFMTRVKKKAHCVHHQGSPGFVESVTSPTLILVSSLVFTRSVLRVSSL